MSVPEEELDKIEESIQEQRDKWNSIVDGLSKKLNDELKTAMDLEATAIAYRQKIMSDIAQYAMKINRLMAKLKVLKKHHFEYFATKYQIKVNTTEKNLLIESETAAYAAKIDMLDTYVQFLTESGKSIDHIIWAVKNKIQIHNITGLD